MESKNKVLFRYFLIVGNFLTFIKGKVRLSYKSIKFNIITAVAFLIQIIHEVVAPCAPHQMLVTFGEYFTSFLIQSYVEVGAHHFNSNTNNFQPLFLGYLAKLGPHRLSIQHLEQVLERSHLLDDCLICLFVYKWRKMELKKTKLALGRQFYVSISSKCH